MCGIQGSGKSELVRHFIKSKMFKAPFVYDVQHHDYKVVDKDCYRYLPTGKASIAELDSRAKDVIKLAKEKKIDAFILDEADMFLSENYQLRENLNDMVVSHRHYNLSLGMVTRRPQDIPTKIVESCHYLFVFSIEGDNVRKKMKNISPDLWKEVQKLEYKDYRFVVKPIGKKPYIHNAIKI